MKVHNMGRMAAYAVVLAALPFSVAAQYKCVSPTGGTSFQQIPCDGGARAQKLDIARPAPADSGAAQAAAISTQRQVAAVDWRQAVERAILSNQPLVGMTIAELDRAVGYPDKVNVSNYGRGLEEQRIYYRGNRTWYVYTKAGAVTAMQNNEGGNPALLARQSCPSRQEMDNEATRLTGSMLGSAEREQGQIRLAQLRRDCS